MPKYFAVDSVPLFASDLFSVFIHNDQVSVEAWAKEDLEKQLLQLIHGMLEVDKVYLVEADGGDDDLVRSEKVVGLRVLTLLRLSPHRLDPSRLVLQMSFGSRASTWGLPALDSERAGA